MKLNQNDDHEEGVREVKKEKEKRRKREKRRKEKKQTRLHPIRPTRNHDYIFDTPRGEEGYDLPLAL